MGSWPRAPGREDPRSRMAGPAPHVAPVLATCPGTWRGLYTSVADRLHVYGLINCLLCHNIAQSPLAVPPC